MKSVHMGCFLCPEILILVLGLDGAYSPRSARVKGCEVRDLYVPICVHVRYFLHVSLTARLIFAFRNCEANRVMRHFSPCITGHKYELNGEAPSIPRTSLAEILHGLKRQSPSIPRFVCPISRTRSQARTSHR